MLSQAFKEGMAFYRQQKGPYNNPYAPGTLEHNEFERGWSQGLKRWPELGVKKHSSPELDTKAEAQEMLRKKKQEYLRSRGE